MSNFSAEITVEAGDATNAVFESILADDAFYPENPARTEFYNDGRILVIARSDQIQHLRANINSTLRLVQVGYEAIRAASKSGTDIRKHPQTICDVDRAAGTAVAAGATGQVAADAAEHAGGPDAEESARV